MNQYAPRKDAAVARMQAAAERHNERGTALHAQVERALGTDPEPGAQFDPPPAPPVGLSTEQIFRMVAAGSPPAADHDHPDCPDCFDREEAEVELRERMRELYIDPDRMTLSRRCGGWTCTAAGELGGESWHALSAALVEIFGRDVELLTTDDNPAARNDRALVERKSAAYRARRGWTR